MGARSAGPAAETSPAPRAPAIELEDVSRTYGSPGGGHPAFTALRDVRLTIAESALTTIVGPSGSGKSTLLAIMGLLDLPTTGQLTLLGHATAGVAERERSTLRARHLGFVFQSFHLMAHRSVLDNVAVGGLYRGLRRAERRRQAADRLLQVGLAEKTSQTAATLSGGERQRTAIARALVGSPRVLLCDEPTGNLDSSSGGAVVELLTALPRQGVSVVVVTHDPAVARLGDQQVRVIDGKVSGDGAS